MFNEKTIPTKCSFGCWLDGCTFGLCRGRILGSRTRIYHRQLGLTMFLPDEFSTPIDEYLGIPLGSTSGTINSALTNNTNAAYRYHTGVQIMGEYTLAKILGPWTAGIGGATQNQLTADTHSGTAYNYPLVLTSHYKS